MLTRVCLSVACPCRASNRTAPRRTQRQGSLRRSGNLARLSAPPPGPASSPAPEGQGQGQEQRRPPQPKQQQRAPGEGPGAGAGLDDSDSLGAFDASVEISDIDKRLSALQDFLKQANSADA